jgi:hypothetical protein
VEAAPGIHGSRDSRGHVFHRRGVRRRYQIEINIDSQAAEDEGREVLSVNGTKPREMRAGEVFGALWSSIVDA